ncbi:hypothetical protein FQN54_006994 [Arachnomyces sp. PD_36]|nr:hypothetical protein FQN54_006994 [Arachnomyces sp. PD_36]
MEQSSGKIIIGLDFGMTFSSAVWLDTKDKVYFIKNWPSSPSDPEPRAAEPDVPTVLSYRPATGVGCPPEILWGTQCEGAYYYWFKKSLSVAEGPSNVPSNDYLLSLDDSEDPNAPSSAERLVVDYLSCFRSHIEAQIKKRTAIVQLEYALAVPSGWTDVVRTRVQHCASMAGMTLGPIGLVNEPEAGAVFQFQQNSSNAKPGDTYIVCDAGGLTVDVVSLTFAGRYSNPLFSRAVEGNHGECGSTFLNSRFQEFLTETLGHLSGWGDRPLRAAMNFFEDTIKRQYNGEEDTVFPVPVPGVANNRLLNVAGGWFLMKSSHLQPIFRPIIEEIYGLVRSQMVKTTKEMEVKEIILVGGFAANNMLYHTILHRVPDCIAVSRPPTPGIAVAHGAMLMARDHNKRR